MNLWQQYYSPRSLQEALRLLREHQGRARIIAGGTDIILELERHMRPGITTLIDITRIPGLDQISLDSEGWIHMGPMVTHNHCSGSRLINERAFALARACWEVGAPQIRNRATVAGNLITASPANDSITPLVAFGGQVNLRSLDAERIVPLNNFYLGVRETVMRPDEIMTDIAFPAVPEGSRSAFFKLGLRRAQAIAIVNIAAVLKLEARSVSQATITLGAVAPTIIHALEAEEFLVGKQLTPEVMAEAGALAARAAIPIDDVRGSAVYRSAMVRRGTIRLLRSLAAGRERDHYPVNPVMLWGSTEWHWTRRMPESYQHAAGKPIVTSINGKKYRLELGQDKTLLRLLRENAGLVGSKEGCAEGECGACTVFLDGMAVMACMVPAPRAHGAEIITVEGLAKDGQLHPIQQAFIDEGAIQCGYCTPGFLMSGAKLLEERSKPNLGEIQQSITGNLCRCTGYYKILSAFERAATIQAADEKVEEFES